MTTRLICDNCIPARVEPRYVLIVAFHFLVALAFAAFAVGNALRGNLIGTVLQGVLAALVLVLGVGVARSV